MRYGQPRTVSTQSNTGRKKRVALFSLFLVASVTPILSVVTGCAGVVSKTKQTSAVASFQLNPAVVNFGQVAIGKQTTQTVSVTNTGTVAVNIVKMTLSDSHFALTGMTTPMALSVGQSSNFAVAVNPTTSVD